MHKTLTWLAAAAAVALSSGHALARNKPEDPHETIRQAAQEARAAAGRARAAADEADATARKANREVRVYRHGDRDVTVAREGDRTERLRTLLQLRSEQEPALKAYVEAVGKGGAREHMVRFDRGGDQKTTPDRLAEMEARLVEQQAAMKGRIAATRTFYAQLDEKQRKVFDAMPMLMFAGPGFGPMLVPVAHAPGAAHPPALPPSPPRAPRS